VNTIGWAHADAAGAKTLAAQTMAISLLAGMAGFVAAGTFLGQAFAWPVCMFIALGAAVSHDEAAPAGAANCMNAAVPPWREAERANRRSS
jgi:hypothetical protein